MFRALLTAALIVLTPYTAQAFSGSESATIQTYDAYAFATSPTPKNGAVFLTIKNTGIEDDALLSAQSDVAETIEIHEMAMRDGIMQMRKLESLMVTPDSKSILEPTGNHIMLIGLNKPLVEGESFPMTLNFENAGDITIDVAITAPGQKLMNHSEHNHSHDH